MDLKLQKWQDRNEEHYGVIYALRNQLVLRLCQAVSQAPLSNWNLPHTPTQVPAFPLKYHKSTKFTLPGVDWTSQLLKLKCL